ncbi:MAG: hypothetical protein ACRDH7_14075 [Actinomycetota bacterium]
MESAVSEITWQQDLATRARRLSTAVVAGLSMGALVGGIGGRIAMFVLRLTSDASLHGAETDDGFIIGQISSSTLFLIIVTGVLGVIGGVFYLAVRSWLPVLWRAASFGMFGGIVGGAGVIHPGGTDFTLLDPLPLAIAMFIALPAIYGVVVSRVIDRRLHGDSGPDASPVWIVGLIPLVAMGFLGPTGLGLSVGMLAIWIVHRKAPRIATIWGSRVVVWMGRAGLLAVTAVALASLVRDITQIL